MPFESSSLHIYIHIPFCDGKCVYCGFYSEMFSEELADRYLDSLAVEFDQHLRSMDRPAPETIYIGGGTPGILTDRQLQRLVDIVTQRISMRQLKEWSVETNPGSITAGKISSLSDAGVTRISIGAQSFSPEILKLMGRRHTVKDINTAFDILHSANINNIGIDLIASFPGVDETAWKHSLQSALSLHPAHISVYALSVEKQSLLHQLIRTGSLSLPGEDVQIENEIMAESEILEHGFRRYEISNYALPGFECLHNISCWLGEDFLGLGASASSRSEYRRWTNRKNISAYVDALSRNQPPPRTAETLSDNDDLNERLVFGFRMQDGVDINEFAGLFRPGGIPPQFNGWLTALERLSQQGIMLKTGNRWKLTERGRLFADYAASELIES